MGGGQFKQAIKQIIAADSIPIQQLEGRKAKEQARLKLFQTFKAKFGGMDKALQEVSDFTKFREFKADLGDGQTLASVTIDKEKATPGTYKMEVNDLAGRTSVISNGFADPNKPILGMGFVVMNLPNGDSKEVYIDEDKASLRGVAEAVNELHDSPCTAAVIKDVSDPDAPWKLILTAKKDGEANQVEIPDFYFMDGDKDLNLDDSRDAKNAQISVDGFKIEAESNDIKDFLPGVNLHLKQAKSGMPFTLNITEDTQKMSGKVKSIVDEVNGILAFITKQNTVDKDSDTSSTFAGDTGLTNIEYRLRNLMQEGFPAGTPNTDSFHWVHLDQLGIEFDKTGQLQFDQNKFQKTLEGDFDGVSQAVSGEWGFARQMRDTISAYTRLGDGLLGSRERGIRDRIKQIDQEIDDKTQRLQQKQQSLTDKFARLEGSLANMQRQQQSLTSMGMGGGGGGGSLVQQLLGG